MKNLHLLVVLWLQRFDGIYERLCRLFNGKLSTGMLTYGPLTRKDYSDLLLCLLDDHSQLLDIMEIDQRCISHRSDEIASCTCLI